MMFLTIKVTNLPLGLKTNNCRQNILKNMKVISCQITGYPLVSGSFLINVFLKDNKNATASVSLTLYIAPK